MAIADGFRLAKNLGPSIVLLLESTHTLDVQRMETVDITGLVRRQLLVVAWLQTDTSGIANPYSDNLSRLALPSFVLLFGERDANLGNRAGGRGGRIFHQAALLIVNQNGLCLCTWRGRNRETTLVRDRSALSVVHGQFGQFAILTLPAQYQKAGNQAETNKDQNEQSNQQIDHGWRQPIIVAVACD